MIIVVGPGDPDLSVLGDHVVVRKTGKGQYTTVRGHSQALRGPLRAVVSQSLRLGERVLVIATDAPSARRLAPLTNEYPEVPVLSGVHQAAAILRRCDGRPLPTVAEVLSFLGRSTFVPDTAVSDHCRRVQLIDERRVDRIRAELSPASDVAIAWTEDRPAMLALSHRPVLQLARPRRSWRGGGRPDPSQQQQARDVVSELEAAFERPTGNEIGAAMSRGLLIGSRNTAGQAHEWARAAREQGLEALSLQYLRPDPTHVFEADITTHEFAASLPRRVRVAASTLSGSCAVLMESLQNPFLLPDYDGGADAGLAQLRAFRRSDFPAGVVFHGSDVRNPSRFAAEHANSPFEGWLAPELQESLEHKTQRMTALLPEITEPKFVTTLDLMDHVPDASWLPQVVRPEFFTAKARPSAGAPVVLHAPSAGGTKGSAVIDPALTRLADSGVIRYVRCEGVPTAMMPRLVAAADIVVDQIGLSLISVAAIEGMAAGKAVVTRFDPVIAARYPAEVPVLPADPHTLGDVVEALASDPARTAELGAAGAAYAREFHDGRLSSHILAQTFSLPRRSLA